MATITLPMVSADEQQELLVQTLAGIRSVLDEQCAELIGGHTIIPQRLTAAGQPRGADHPHGERQQPPITLAESGTALRDALLISRPLAPECCLGGREWRH